MQTFALDSFMRTQGGRRFSASKYLADVQQRALDGVTHVRGSYGVAAHTRGCDGNGVRGRLGVGLCVKTR